MTIKAPKKLIEVALPLDAINAASAREKSIRHGHPSTLHLWWARRPLAAARAVLFAQLVNDPGGERGWGKTKGQTKEDAEKERQRLFRLIEQLVQWENTNNEDVLEQAREEIRKSWRETCELNKGQPGFDPDKLPPFHDPFAGGGSIPLEAQRLGLESHASDLNPVAVLINKAMIEIPPKFAGRPPVGPIPPGDKQTKQKETGAWPGATGLAEDVRRYGAWMRAEAEKRIGHLYPKVKITKEMASERPDLKKYVGRELTVIAWLWARTVPSPNPAVGGAHVPLVSSFWLSKKPGKETWIEPVVEGSAYRFVVRKGKPKDAKAVDDGTVNRKGGRCVLTGVPVAFKYLREEAKAGRFRARLMAVVAEGERERVYLGALPEQERAAEVSAPAFQTGAISHWPGRTNVVEYGMTEWRDLFTDRQLVALTTFSDLVTEAAVKARQDAVVAGMPDDDRRLHEGGTGATAYSDALAIYLTFALNKTVDGSSTLCRWMVQRDSLFNTLSKQALPMTWDFAEVNVLADCTRSLSESIRWTAESVEGPYIVERGRGSAVTADATSTGESGRIFSSDPPYYDNIGYADLSDYFYVWLRRSLGSVMPDLFGTLLVPKAEELVATPYRHGGRENAERFFLDGMGRALAAMRDATHPAVPTTIYYAFKQSESDDQGDASTGWETFLAAVLDSGWEITATWPMRTERGARSISIGTNALASSIILALRPRGADASTVSRRDFLRELRDELPIALEIMIGGAAGRAPIAPVDLAQAAIGPGMAIFSRHAQVLEANGEPMSVRQALIHINKAIDDYFTEAEGEMDADTRFCVDWFQQYGFGTGKFGEADVLARAKGTAVEGLVKAGVLHAQKGDVRLVGVKEYAADWDPREDERVPVWEACHQLCRALDTSEAAAGQLLALMPDKQEAARQLAYRLYTLCERKGWAQDAGRYNALVTSWPAIVERSREAGIVGEQLELG